MTEESLSTPEKKLLVLPAACACSAARKSLLGLTPAIAGFCAAAWKSGVPAAAFSAEAMLSPTVLNRMDRKTATPSVPPICRKNVEDAVATPMSRGQTEFCMASISGCMVLPRP